MKSMYLLLIRLKQLSKNMQSERLLILIPTQTINHPDPYGGEFISTNVGLFRLLLLLHTETCRLLQDSRNCSSPVKPSTLSPS